MTVGTEFLKKLSPPPEIDDENMYNETLTTSLTPLRFCFRGCSVWLELEQFDNDLDQALTLAAQQLHVHRIPGPHVTVLYGMDHLPLPELRRRFRALSQHIPQQHWPPFHVKGIYTDVEYNGVNGAEMDMAWMELTLGATPAHTSLQRALQKIMMEDPQDLSSSDDEDSSSVWKPHLSLVYENPEQAKLNLHVAMSVLLKLPTLTSIATRRVTALSLWNTNGTMEEWKCLERLSLL